MKKDITALDYGAFVRIELKEPRYLVLDKRFPDRSFELKPEATENSIYTTEITGRYLGRLGAYDRFVEKDVILVNPFHYVPRGLGHTLIRKDSIRVPLELIRDFQQLGSVEDIVFKVKPGVRPRS